MRLPLFQLLCAVLLAGFFPFICHAGSVGISPTTISFDALPNQTYKKTITLYRNEHEPEQIWQVKFDTKWKEAVSVVGGNEIRFKKGEMECPVTFLVSTEFLPVEQTTEVPIVFEHKIVPKNTNTVAYGLNARLFVHIVTKPTEDMRAIDLSTEKNIPHAFDLSIETRYQPLPSSAFLRVSNLSNEMYKNVPVKISVTLPHVFSVSHLQTIDEIKSGASLNVPMEADFSRPGTYVLSALIGDVQVQESWHIRFSFWQRLKQWVRKFF